MRRARGLDFVLNRAVPNRAGRLTALLALALFACDGEPSIDAGPDTGPPAEDLVLEARPDASERTDCAATPPAAGEVRAKHVVCDAELLEGALAMGRVGDIVLENARARFIVRTGAESASTIGAPAGGLIDAALESGPDLVKEIFPIFDLVSMQPSAIEVIDAGAGGEARVRVLFEDAPIGLVETVLPGLGAAVRLRGTLDYVLRPDEDALAIEIDLTTREGFTRSGGRMGVLALLGGVERFQVGYGVIDEDHVGGAGDALVGARDAGAVALWLDAEGTTLTAVETIHLMRGARTSALQGALSRVAVRVGLGTTEARALAAARPSEQPVLPLRGTPGDHVIVRDASDAPQLRTRFDADGLAELALPLGAYSLLPGFGQNEGAAAQAITHDGSEVLVTPLASARFTVEALVEGAPMVPVRVTVESAGEELDRFVAIGATERRVPPGAHRVTVSHGLEHDIFTLDLTLGAGTTATLSPSLPRVLDTDGWVSVDLHLHSDLSTDSVHPVEDAVRMLAAEGVQAASSSDHDYVTDYAAIGARAGVDLLLVSGVEVSTTVFGHINGYPLLRRPERAGAGAPVWFEMAPVEVFDALRALGDAELGGALVQINHPRFGGAAFFTTVGLDRETGRATSSPTALGFQDGTDLDDFGFEALEIFNGCCRGGDEEAFLDFLALAAAGRRFTMVGNSDSHDAERPPGTPRSFVRVPDEASFAWEDLASGLRAGEATVAAGVFVTAELMGPVVGDSVAVRVRAAAPPWATTDRLRIFAGREAVIDRPLTSTADVRIDEVIDVPLGGAGFVLVRVDGSAAPEPLQRFPAFGVTNPLYVSP